MSDKNTRLFNKKKSECQELVGHILNHGSFRRARRKADWSPAERKAYNRLHEATFRETAEELEPICRKLIFFQLFDLMDTAESEHVRLACNIEAEKRLDKLVGIADKFGGASTVNVQVNLINTLQELGQTELGQRFAQRIADAMQSNPQPLTINHEPMPDNITYQSSDTGDSEHVTATPDPLPVSDPTSE